jgi:hypothetical protein
MARPERGRTLELRVQARQSGTQRHPRHPARLAVLKLEMADRLMSAPAVDVYDVVDEDR